MNDLFFIMVFRFQVSGIMPISQYFFEEWFNPVEADKGLIPRRLRRFNAFVDTPLLCGGVVHHALVTGLET